jgi:uncharacterized protein (TIGR01370 family)
MSGRPRILLAGLLAGICLVMPAVAAGPGKFAVYYSDKAPLERFEPYTLLVLDRDHHVPLQPLKERGKLLLGYLSLGEAEKRNSYFDELKQRHLLFNENKAWKGSYTINLRDQAWVKMVIEEIIPKMLADGFDGLFLDTLDSPLELERTQPKQYAGMRDASIALVRAIRLHYPDLKIMVNRAYPILPDIAPDIDMALGECLYGDYDFGKKKYIRVDKDTTDQQLAALKAAQARNPRLVIYTLDYANKNDPRAISEIYRKERANGFIPYVATVDLDELIGEPNP